MTVRAKIISLRLAYLLFSLPVCQAIDQPYLLEAMLLSKHSLRAFCIGLLFLHVKQNSRDCTGSIFVPPVDAEQRCTGSLEQRVLNSCRAV